MAINIFSGSPSGKTKGSVNSAAASDRAKAAKSALTGDSQTSNSGSTAVKSSGTLSKVGNFIGKAAGVASKFIPGLGGAVARGVANLFNDPEWWQSVPGDALTTNEPLSKIRIGTQLAGGSYVGNSDVSQLRPALLEINSLTYETAGNDSGATYPDNLFTTDGISLTTRAFPVVNPSDRQITQYLMAEVRKVVNAVPLQDASDYRVAFTSGASIYALWRQLKKFDYMLKHGQTYLPSMNTSAFPLFQTENAAWLQSTINRLEEYLRANVRLPHTLCEYLAWRFGRVYKSNNSAKAALVIYNVLPITATPQIYDAYISFAMDAISATPTIQRANTDLYNAYYDHDYMVEIKDDTQFKFDCKEFMLRLNLVGVTYITPTSSATGWVIPQYAALSAVENLVALDSNLDNPTTFMASTVSAIGADSIGNITRHGDVLFPVMPRLCVYAYNTKPRNSNGQYPLPLFYAGFQCYQDAALVVDATRPLRLMSRLSNYASQPWMVSAPIIDNMAINIGAYDTTVISGIPQIAPVDSSGELDWSIVVYQLLTLFVLKAVDVYNAGVYVPCVYTGDQANTPPEFLDATSISIDAGQPTWSTIATEQVYAFANLVDVNRKHSMSYHSAEKLVARDVANTIESLDVSAISSKK